MIVGLVLSALTGCGSERSESTEIDAGSPDASASSGAKVLMDGAVVLDADLPDGRMDPDAQAEADARVEDAAPPVDADASDSGALVDASVGDAASSTDACVAMAELPNGLDDDCDGTLDEGTELHDDDGDGYCEHDTACTDPKDLPGDCDDDEGAIHPGATEVCGDSVDNDCDGSDNQQDTSGCVLYYRDEDGDDWGHESDAQCWCEPTGIYDISAPGNQDCLDTNADVNPDATTPQTAAYWTGSTWSWDYNCDGTVTRSDSRTANYSCCIGDSAVGGCWGDNVFTCYYSSGWVAGAPACGTNGTWATSCEWPSCDAAGTQSVMQRCY